MTSPNDMRAIDVRHLGREHVICAWQVGDALVDPGPASAVETLLEALGDWRPARILLTHIHLDHAGATGVLARRWPEVEVCVHARGAPHVVDPAKLLASASRLYGPENMERLWGEVAAVDQTRLRVLEGGETLRGGWRVAATPGHASHHVCYLHEDSGRAFCGDVAGVRLPGIDFVVAPTPPPDIDLEAWERSIALVESWRPTSLGITHFGAIEDVEAQFDGVRARLRDWGPLARDGSREEFVAAVHAQIRANADPAAAAAYEQAASADQLWQGLRRYWDKRAERDAAA